MDDVVVNKCTIIERCIKRIKEEYDSNPENLKNYTKQDSIILNLQRACEASIDLAMHVIAQKKLGVPQTSREAFEKLGEHKIIPSQLSQNLKAMVGFRNIAVHDYQKINLNIIQKILEEHLQDYKAFTSIMTQFDKE